VVHIQTSLISEKSLTVDDNFSLFGAHTSADLLLIILDDECNDPVKDIPYSGKVWRGESLVNLLVLNIL